MSKTAHSYFRQHIELHFDDHDIDVVVRKRKQGYAIYWADDEEPLAVITAVVTAVGGVTGWAAHARLGAGFGPLLAGVLVGALCISLLFQGGLGAWLAGLLVGLNLGLYLVAAWNIQDPFGGPLLIALLAAFGASQFCKWFTSFRKFTCDPAGTAPSPPARRYP